MTVPEYVNRIKHLDNELSFKQRQKSELFDMLVSITAPPSESVQKTSEDKMSSLISQYVDLGNEIIEIYQKKFAAENEFQALVSQLPPQWEEFLLLRHLGRMSIEDIAEEMGYSQEWCWKTNKKACAALEELLNAKSVQ